MMMSPLGIRLDVATLVSTAIECILYGISLVMFGGTMWALIHGRSKGEIHWLMALVALILVVLSTIHVVVDIQRLVVGFISKADSFPGGPVGFFADITQRTFLIKNIVYILQTLVGDGFVIYRCYVVWQRFRVVILPAVVWCATSATSAGLLYHMSHATGSEDALWLYLGRWIVPFSLLTMTTNILSSVLLGYLIWTTGQNEPEVVRVPSTGSGVEATLVLRILVDATVLHTLALFVLLVFYTYENAGQFIILDVVTPMISITFYIVPVRIAIARNDAVRVSPGALSPLRFAVRAIPSPLEPRFSGARRSSI